MPNITQPEARRQDPESVEKASDLHVGCQGGLGAVVIISQVAREHPADLANWAGVLFCYFSATYEQPS